MGGIGGQSAQGGTSSQAGASGQAGSGQAGSSTGLDPDLSIPPSGTPCMTPGYGTGGCGSLEVCRISSATGGTCEGGGGGNLNAFCSAGLDCDILFECYLGRCTNFCTVGTSECGLTADCIDVGNKIKGVCKP